jgi:SMC interacting uncharacterized protein involved in chromosome segregation
MEGRVGMNSNYIDIMIQSLEKKVTVLNRLIELNKQQKLYLQDPNLSPEEFEKNMDRKASLIDELNQLDMGFEELFGRVRDTLNGGREAYADQIKRMQDLIREITEKSNTVQTQELRNKEQVQRKFADIREQVKGVRNSQKVVRQYYQNMIKQGANEPHFLDNKK